MEFTGQFDSLMVDCATGRQKAVLTINEDASQMYEKFKNCGIVSIAIKKYRKKRSLDANAYYWLLVGKICRATGASSNHIHNIMLDRYGELDRMPDGSLIPFCIRDDIDYLEFPYPHLKPTQKTLSKGNRLYRWYYQIKGSSEYDTKEMSRLIKGIAGECREMGMETLPKEELERMMNAYDGRRIRAQM